MNEEYHPYLKMFNISGGIVGFLLTVIFLKSDFGMAIIGVALFVGAIWVHSKTKGFTFYDQAPGDVKAVAIIEVLAGVFLGVFVIVVLAALRVEINRKD